MEFERDVHEMGDAASPDDVQAVKEERKGMERDTDLFDQCINTIKKLIISTQGADE